MTIIDDARKARIESALNEPVVKIMRAIAEVYGVPPADVPGVAQLQASIADELIRQGNDARIPYAVMAASVMQVALCMAAAHTDVQGIHWKLMKMMREIAPHLAAERARVSKERDDDQRPSVPV